MVFFIFVWLGLAIAAIPVAKSKNRDGGGWFAITLVFGIFAFIPLLVMSPALTVEQWREANRPTKNCPECAEPIKAEAIKCRWCGAEATVLRRRRELIPESTTPS